MAKQQIRVSTRQVTARYWDNEDLAELEDSSGFPKLRLTMIGLWAVADGAGRFEWKPRVLAAKIFPFQLQDQINVGPIMELFAEKAFLLKYEVDGKWYGAWPHWSEHNDFRKTEGHYPPPAGFVDPVKPPNTPNKTETEVERESEVERETEAETEVETEKGHSVSGSVSGTHHEHPTSFTSGKPTPKPTATPKPTPRLSAYDEGTDYNADLKQWLCCCSPTDQRKFTAVLKWTDTSNYWKGVQCRTMAQYRSMEEQYDKYYRKLPPGKKPHDVPEETKPALEGSVEVDEVEVVLPSQLFFEVEE